MSAIKNESTDELLRQILPSLAVQIRIPLGNMYSTLQRLLRRYPATGEELAPFYQSYYRMLRLAGNLSDAQELTSEEPLPLANEDIVAFVHQICLQAETPAELCGQRIIFQSSKSAHIMAFHPSSIERLLLNLLSNSMKFSGKGCLITVSVTVRRDTVELTVEDTGPGLDPAVPLFTPYLPPGPRDSSPRGLGLGLLLCRRAALGHGGNLLVSSLPNVGTKVTVSLPNVRASHSLLRDSVLDYAGGFNHTLVELSDALPAAAFLPPQLDH